MKTPAVEWLRKADAAKLLKMSTRSVLAMAAAGKIRRRPIHDEATHQTVMLLNVEDLERIAHSFPGVEKSFAIQAGREIRIMVQPERISDEDSIVLSKDIARKIEKELTYPGQIKVTVIREMRAVEVAK